MILYLTFENKSNPYIFFGNEKKVEKELKKWDKNYILQLTEKNDNIIYYKVYDKIKNLTMYSF